MSRLPHIVAFGLLLAIGAAAYLQLHEIFLRPASTSAQPSVNPSSLNTPAQSKKNFNIASFNLFGKAGAKPLENQVVTEKLPETKLKLTLTGVLAGQDNEINGALIEGPDRATSYYRIGDQLPGNATLNRVLSDRVVIQRGGKLENLYFLENFSSTNSITADYRDEEKPTVEPAPVATRAIKSFDNSRKQSIKDRLSKLRKKIRNQDN